MIHNPKVSSVSSQVEHMVRASAVGEHRGGVDGVLDPRAGRDRALQLRGEQRRSDIAGDKPGAQRRRLAAGPRLDGALRGRCRYGHMTDDEHDTVLALVREAPS